MTTHAQKDAAKWRDRWGNRAEERRIINAPWPETDQQASQQARDRFEIGLKRHMEDVAAKGWQVAE